MQAQAIMSLQKRGAAVDGNGKLLCSSLSPVPAQCGVGVEL